MQSFLRDDITVYCREAPSGTSPKRYAINKYITRATDISQDFTDHQRDVFCVFSGPGVRSLREHLNREARRQDSDESLYDDVEDVVEEAQQVAGLMNATGLNGGDEMDEEFAEDSEGVAAEEQG